MISIDCFKAYDIRGRLGEELDSDIAYRIGRAFAFVLEAKTVVVGRDNRLSSPELESAVISGLRDGGCDALTLGMCGTEEVYFATSKYNADGGMCVTASHNPIEYNGIKLVGKQSIPIDPKTQIPLVKQTAECCNWGKKSDIGSVQDISKESRAAYVDHVLSFIDINNLKPLKILVNPGHGAGGPTFDAIEDRLKQFGAPLSFVKICHEPDGNFPAGIPNPLIKRNRKITASAVVENSADFGVALDGDFDRCFFFDSSGKFVDGEYVVGLLASYFLGKHKGARIIHDPRIVWSTQHMVNKASGVPIQSRTGHAFIKQKMRSEDAIYGGEMSAHHYFREFFYCDSGMIPWLLVADLVSQHGSLDDLTRYTRDKFPSSGELNFNIKGGADILEGVRREFECESVSVETVDGLSMDMGKWRFNLRSSNTEPVVRLNVEAKKSAELVEIGVERVTSVLARY